MEPEKIIAQELRQKASEMVALVEQAEKLGLTVAVWVNEKDKPGTMSFPKRPRVEVRVQKVSVKHY